MISYASTETDSYKEALIIHIIKSVVKYGRWDDVIEIYNSRKNHNDHKTSALILKYMGNVIENDIVLMKSNSPISLLAKWLPSEKQDIDFVKDFIKVLSEKDLQVKNFKDYRKNVLVPLRRHLDIVEHYVTEGKLDDIDFAKVPSCAMRKYRTKFYQSEKFVAYIEQVTSGEKKINELKLEKQDIEKNIEEDVKQELGWNDKTYQILRKSIFLYIPISDIICIKLIKWNANLMNHSIILQISSLILSEMLQCSNALIFQ
jgi:hypothetical protein